MARKPEITAWFQRLADDRLEIFFKVANVGGVPDMKVRASGAPQHMNQLADWFEEQTGLNIEAPWRVKVRPVIPGQAALFDAKLVMGEVQLAPDTELSSGATVDSDA